MDVGAGGRLPCLDHALSVLAGGDRLGWHRHREPYLAVVLSGTLEEVSEWGRRQLGPGSAVVHAPFEAHGDRIGRRPVRMLNLPLTADPRRWPAVASRLDDLDGLQTVLEHDPGDALDWLASRLTPEPTPESDWPDQLARALRLDPDLSMGDWAERHGLRRETLSRGFGKAYAATPKQFRAWARARQAWNGITSSRESLGEIAHRLGFSDQSHMCRDIARMTGRPPGHWRASTGFKTAWALPA